MLQFIIFIDKKIYDILVYQVSHIVYVDFRQIIRLVVRLTMKENILIFSIIIYIIF